MAHSGNRKACFCLKFTRSLKKFKISLLALASKVQSEVKRFGTFQVKLIETKFYCTVMFFSGALYGC